MGISLLIFVAAETGASELLPSKMTSASAAIPAFRHCLLSRWLRNDHSPWGGVKWDWVHLVRGPLNGLLYQPGMIEDDDDEECGAVGGMSIGRGKGSTRRKPAPVPLCPPQIAHDLTWARTRVTSVGSRRLTTWAVAWPKIKVRWDVHYYDYMKLVC
jgi:hypothetical protein